MTQSMSDIFEMRKKEYFAKRFSALLDKWKEKEKAEGRTGTQEAFAKKIHGSKNSITRYKQGTDFPSPSSMDAICQEFEVQEEVFYQHSLSDFERGGDKSFHDEKEQQLRKHCESIGLSVELVAFITGEKHIQTGFPFQSFKTLPPQIAESFPSIVKTESPFQIIDGKGNAHFLEKPDLDYLRQLQTEIESFIRFKFFEERQRMLQEDREHEIERAVNAFRLTKDQILSKCTFRDSDYSIENKMDVMVENAQAVNKAVSAIEAENGKRLARHWKMDEIDFLCLGDEKGKQEFIKKIIEKGDIIDDG